MKKFSILQGKNGENYLFPFVLLTSLFFMWGLANNMTDTLLAAFKKIMSMTDFQTSLIQVAFYGSYFCFALPAAFFIKKYSYKSGILLGLSLYAAGCFLFYPAGHIGSYGFYLFALYVLAGGCSVLETAASPYILSMGTEKTATQRLNLAQAFNPIGCMVGILVSQSYILGKLNQAGEAERAVMTVEELGAIQTTEMNAVTMTYVFVGMVLLIIFLLILFSRMPKGNETVSTGKDNFREAFGRLRKNRRYILGVITEFFYIGAQTGVWSYNIRYVMNQLQYNEKESASIYIYSLIAFAVARFIFTALMKIIKPYYLLVVAGIGAAICSLLVIGTTGRIGVAALIMISFFMSLMFPTIYGLAMYKIGEDAKFGGSGLIMSILGGAVFAAIQGYVSDTLGSISLSFLVPLICFVVVILYGLWISRISRKTAAG
ncbi:MAG: L-fucose:H+ symporter permease [Tannerellaceae bacterium]|nr:L-fucose:H+ symporter permease [Tannerellaceae bacterium]